MKTFNVGNDSLHSKIHSPKKRNLAEGKRWQEVIPLKFGIKSGEEKRTSKRRSRKKKKTETEKVEWKRGKKVILKKEVVLSKPSWGNKGKNREKMKLYRGGEILR